MRRSLVTFLIFLAAGFVGHPTGGQRVAAAPSTDAQRLRAARTHYEKAVSHYNLDEIEAALEEFREAYRFKPDPSFLFNIAQCYRKLGQREAAIDFYRKYVRASPDATNRAEAERRIAELKAQADDAARAPAADGSGAAASALAGAPAAVPGPAAAPVKPPASPPIDLSASPPAPSPSAASPSASLASSAAPAGAPAPAGSPAFYQRWWFWVAVGAVAAGATITAVALSSAAPSPYVGTIPPGTVQIPAN